MRRMAASVSDRNARTRSSTSASTVASRPVVGSSRTSNLGLQASAMAMTTRCCMPPGELVRVALQHSLRIGDAHTTERVERHLPRLVLRVAEQGEALHDLRLDPQDRVQRLARILVHHRRLRRPELPELGRVHVGDVVAVDQDSTAHDPTVLREVAHRREGGRRLPAPGLADEPVGLARSDLERDAAQHLSRHAAYEIGDFEIDDLERRRPNRRGDVQGGGRRHEDLHETLSEGLPEAAREAPATSRSRARRTEGPTSETMLRRTEGPTSETIMRSTPLPRNRRSG